MSQEVERSIRRWGAIYPSSAGFRALRGRPNDRRNLSAEELYRALHCSGLEDAVLIWNVILDTPPRASLAWRILAAAVSGSPTRNAPSGPAMASNCRRVGGDSAAPTANL